MTNLHVCVTGCLPGSCELGSCESSLGGGGWKKGPESRDHLQASWAEQAGYLKLVLPLRTCKRDARTASRGGLQNTLPLGPAERSGTVGGWRKVGYRQEAGKARYLTVSDWGRTHTRTHTHAAVRHTTPGGVEGAKKRSWCWCPERDQGVPSASGAMEHPGAQRREMEATRGRSWRGWGRTGDRKKKSCRQLEKVSDGGKMRDDFEGS